METTELRFAHLIAENTPDALVAVSPQGIILYWNRGAESFFGYTKTEAFGRSIHDLIVPSVHRNESLTSLDKATSAGSSLRQSIRQRKDGTLVLVDIRVRAVENAPGCGRLVTMEITDLTRTESASGPESFAGRIRALLESMPDALVLVDNTGRIVFANSQLHALFGYERTDLPGKPFEVLLPERLRLQHADHRSSYLAVPRARIMAEGQELCGRRADGSEFPVEVSFSPLYSPDGTLVLAAVRDVSHRKHADAKFRSLVEWAPDAFILVDRSGSIVLVNSQTERLFGYDRRELLGQRIDLLVPHGHEETRPLRGPGSGPRAEGNAIPTRRELNGLRKDGTPFPIEITLSPVEADEGLLVLTSIRDLTERNVAEEIRRTELEEKNRRIEEATRLKSEFLANMSHELRTPLTGIIGFTEILVDGKAGPLNAKQKEYLGDVLDSGNHLLRLINDILDLSKIEAGKMELVIEEFSLTGLLEEVSGVITPSMQGKGLRFDRELAPDLPPVTLDQQKLKQIIYNLLSNAVKFTDEGGRIRLAARAVGNDDVHIEVVDTGIGIPADDMGKLFEEFQQLQGGLDSRYPGTGLGLALTRRMVGLLHGHIEVRSEEGKGSTFAVHLPRVFSNGNGNGDERAGA